MKILLKKLNLNGQVVSGAICRRHTAAMIFQIIFYIFAISKENSIIFMIYGEKHIISARIYFNADR